MLCKDDIFLSLGAGNSSGVVSIVLPVPGSGLPPGLKFYNQAYVLDPLAPGRPLKITVSNGGEGVIGN